jgi:hypothetical protein
MTLASFHQTQVSQRCQRYRKIRDLNGTSGTSFRNVTSRPARLGPSPTSTTRTALISLPPCPTRNHARSLKEPSSNILLQPCTAMRSSQLAFALSSLAGACEAFRFTVWLGDKCTITGTGTKASDQELLVIPQVVGTDGCMVRLFAQSQSGHT